MAFGDPSPDAQFFTIDAGEKRYDAFFDLNTVGESHYGAVRYRELNSPDSTPWVYLSPSAGNSATDNEFDASRMTTAEGTDAEIDSVDFLNDTAMVKVFYDA